MEQEREALVTVLGTAELNSLRLALERFDFAAARRLLAPSIIQEQSVAPCCPP